MLGVLISFAFALGMAGIARLFVQRLIVGMDPAAEFGVCGLVGLGLAGWLTLFIGLLPGGLQWGMWVIALISCLGLARYVKYVWLVHIHIARPNGFEWAWLAALGIAGLFALVGVLAPCDSLDWDSLSYHLAVPKLWLAAGHIEYIPFIHQSNFPFVVDNLYIWGLIWGGEQGAKAFSLVFLSLGLFAVFGLARQLYGRQAGMWATLGFATIPVVMWESGTGYIDVAHGLFAGLGAALVAMGIAASYRRHSGAVADPNDRASGRHVSGRKGDEPLTPTRRSPLSHREGTPTEHAGKFLAVENSPRLVILGAILLGFAVGSKYTGLQAVFASAATIVVAGIASKDAARSLKTAVTVGVVALAVGSPWYVKNAMWTGNPVFPFFFERFGGRNWDQRRADIYRREQDSFGVGRTAQGLDPAQVGHAILGLAYQPGRYINPDQQRGGGFPQGSVGVAVLCGALAWMFSGRGRRAEGLLLGFAGLSLLMWFALSQQSRYVLGLAPPLCILLGGAVARLRAGPVLAAIAVMQAAYSAILVRSAVTDHQLPVALGRISRDEYLARSVPFYAPAKLIDEVAKDGKVALYDETFGYLLDVPYFWANPGHCTLIPYDTLADGNAYAGEMKREGFTHIYVNFWGTWDPRDTERWLAAAGVEGPPSPLTGAERKALADNWELKWRLLLGEAVASGRIRVVRAFGTAGAIRSLLLEVAP